MFHCEQTFSDFFTFFEKSLAYDAVSYVIMQPEHIESVGKQVPHIKGEGNMKIKEAAARGIYKYPDIL